MFLYHKWLELPLQTRVRIANEFGIIKRTSTHVFDNVVQSDGYDIKEVEQALNLNALQQKLDTTETDLNILWEWLVNGKPVIPVASEPVPLTTSPVTTSEIIKKKRGKKNK